MIKLLFQKAQFSSLMPIHYWTFCYLRFSLLFKSLRSRLLPRLYLCFLSRSKLNMSTVLSIFSRLNSILSKYIDKIYSYSYLEIHPFDAWNVCYHGIWMKKHTDSMKHKIFVWKNLGPWKEFVFQFNLLYFFAACRSYSIRSDCAIE